ncbi:MAG: tetratricopeptide repeat protein [Capsulimonadaceae bacterium]
MAAETITQAPSVLCLYAERYPLPGELGGHLDMMGRQGLIAGWHDRDVAKESEDKHENEERIEAADLILLLVSPAFLATEYCYEPEMDLALKRHDEGTARVIPIILSPCEWRSGPLGSLQPLPKDGKPISPRANQDLAILDVARALRRVVEEIRPSTPCARDAGTVNGAGRASQIPPVTPRFVGRDLEIEAVIGMLSRDRLVTIIGPGGIGKSEILRRAGAMLAERNPDARVHYVNLAACRSAGAAAGAISAALGLMPAAAIAGLASQLERGAVYLLDDIQQATAADDGGMVGFIRSLYQYSTARFVVTSREAIQLSGLERCVPIVKLPPDVAGRLFDTSAEAAGYTSCPGDDERRVRLLRDLDGYPLAITIVCGLLGDVTLARLLREWDRLIAMARNAGGAYRSHLTSLDYALSVSFTLLPEGLARALFVLFADLPAGATGEMLKAVTSEESSASLIADLLRQSLVEGSGSRYRMLVPVREFASRVIVTDAGDLRARLDVYLKWFASHWGGDDKQWVYHTRAAVDNLAAELPNIHAALERDPDTRPEYVADVIDSLSRYYALVTGEEAMARLRQGADAALVAKRLRLRANCTRSIGDVHRTLGEYPHARASYGAAWSVYQSVGDRPGEAVCQFSLGTVHRILGEYPQARTRFEEARPIFHGIGDLNGEANCVHALGAVHQACREYTEAWTCYKDAWPIYESVGNRLGAANCLNGLGDVYRLLRDYTRALECYEEAGPIYEDLGDRLGAANCIQSLGDVHQSLGACSPARECYDESLRLYRELGSRHAEAGAYQRIAFLLAAEQRLHEAREWMEKARSLFAAIGNAHWADNASRQMAEWARTEPVADRT